MKKPTPVRAMQAFDRNLHLYNSQNPGKKVEVTPALRRIVYLSMIQLAREVRKEENTEVLKQSFGVIPGLLLTGISLWAKRFVRNQYVRQAQLRADTEQYKIYVVQGKGLTFKLISTRDFKYNKAVRVFKNDLTAKDMEAVSCFIAYPKKR